MAHAEGVCRVCGKTYKACLTPKANPNEFRWQDVACSPECGKEYLRRVLEARNPAPVKARPPRRAPKREISVEPDVLAPASSEPVEAVMTDEAHVEED